MGAINLISENMMSIDFKKAQDEYQFFETPQIHSEYIYNDYNPKHKVKVADVCCGLGSLSKIWYDNGHDITLYELNEEFIPELEQRFPLSTIIHTDFLTEEHFGNFDVILCNPPFRIDNELVYPYFFVKLLQEMLPHTILYFICPRMFYIDQHDINIELEIQGLDLHNFIKENHKMHPKYFYDRYGFIELNTSRFRFNKQMVKKMIEKRYMISEFIYSDDKYFVINPYFEIRYMRNIFDFACTKCQCGLFKCNR